MTDQHDDTERMLDEAISSIRGETMDKQTAAEAVDRVWQRIADGNTEAERALRGCADFSELIPALLEGSLTGPRAILLQDHLDECIACRRLHIKAREGPRQRAEHRTDTAPSPARRTLALAAAAVLALGLGLAAAWTGANLIAERGLSASLESVEGSLLLVLDDGGRALASSDRITARQTLRTTKNSGAVLRLDDGSLIEIDSRSQLLLRRSLRGTTLRLDRGNIIVRAAEQHGERLFVATGDCLVAVTGTVFAVDHGLKGSRVSVLEGSVEVRQGSHRQLLNPGEQLTTNDRLQSVAISEQIAWSRNADVHRALLHELSLLQREVAHTVDPLDTRTSTALLDMAPPDTLVFVAVPNLTEGLGEARQLLNERLASSDTLREWWHANFVATGIDRQIDDLLDRLLPLGDAVAEEVAITVSSAAIDGGGGPLVYALLDDAGTFTQLLREEMGSVNSLAGRSVISVLEDPHGPIGTPSEITVWVNERLFAASNDAEQLSDLARRLSAAAPSGFAGTELHTRLDAAYRGGVSWLVGIDLGPLLDRAADHGSEQDMIVADQLGLTGLSTLVLERHRIDGTSAISAELAFDGQRRGMAAWLAEPAPMGSLEFVSQDASLAAALVAKDAAVIFDELVQAIATADSGALDELDRFQDEIGIDLREDLAAALGGEGVVALDGPLLPTPAWKLVAEVYDPNTLQSTIERAIGRINQSLAEHDREGLSLEEHGVAGRSYWSVQAPQAQVAAVYTMTDGYLVVGPELALVSEALQYRDSGVHLPASQSFLELLPDNGYTDCSALLYRNLGPLAASLPESVLGEISPDAWTALAEPMLFCVYGEEDRIAASGVGDGFLRAGQTLGLAGLLRHLGHR
jgi:ferric-dicitrate binding protein FerR (iron transport regulator)